MAQLPDLVLSAELLADSSKIARPAVREGSGDFFFLRGREE